MVKKTEYDYLFNLIAIAYADGEISELEMLFLRRKSADLNINSEILDNLISDASNFHLIVPTHRIERMQYMDDCIEMAILDGVIHPKEMKLCKLVCDMLSLPQSYLDEQLTVKSITVK